MVHGQTEVNVREMEARRFGDWAVGGYGVEKAIDEYHQMYQVHYPGEYREAGRPVRTTPIHDRLAARGAVFAETFGWERAKWFAPAGVEERYGFRRMNWFDAVGGECRAVRERVGVLDLTAFSKFDVTGPDAASFLDRILANRVPERAGSRLPTRSPNSAASRASSPPRGWAPTGSIFCPPPSRGSTTSTG